MLVVFVALEMEERRILPHLMPLERQVIAGFPVAVCRRRAVAVCRTGMGRRAGLAAAAVISVLKPQAVVSLGFAGASRDRLASGEFLLAQEVKLCATNGDLPLASDLTLLEKGEEAAAAIGVPAHAGTAGTVAGVLGTSAAKRAVGQDHEVDVVEMESYWIACAAAEADVAFLAARVVLDRVGDSIPVVEDAVKEDGRVNGGAVVRHLLRHPGHLPHFLALSRASETAGASLGKFAGEFINLWSRDS